MTQTAKSKMARTLRMSRIRTGEAIHNALGASGLLTPVFVVLTVRATTTDHWSVHPLVLLVVTVATVSFPLLYLGEMRKANVHLRKVQTASRSYSELVSFLASVLPLALLPFSETPAVLVGVFALCIYLAIASHGDMWHLNPLLAVLGYVSWQVTTDGGSFTYVSRTRWVTAGRTIWICDIRRPVMLAGRRRTDDRHE